VITVPVATGVSKRVGRRRMETFPRTIYPY
jgi:hypothetical protein